MRPRSAAVLVFCTSAAVLVLEILAGRLMAPYVGESLETYTGIIGTVLAGIALGSASGGRLSDRHDPRRLAGPALVLGGALSWLALPIVSVLGPGVGEGPVAIVVLAVAAFFLPAAVLSAVSPMAAKLRLDDLSETGTVVGGLSAAGTAGALAGTFVTGFVLVAALPSRPIVIVVGGLLVLGGLALWVRLARTRPSPPALVGVVLAALLAPSVSGPCQYETAYFCARVTADPARRSGRILWLDQLRHSYVDLEDPTHLEFRYVRLFADVVDALPPGRLDALHLGGGGFTFPRYLTARRPGTTNLVLEIDAQLVRIAEQRLGLRRGPDLQVDVGDARLALGDLPTDGFDVVVGDAFSGLSAPWHLTTTEVVAELDRALRPGGVYVVNVIDGGPSRFARAELATLRRSFDHVAVILPPERAGQVPIGNQVLVASDSPLPAQLAVDPADGRVLRGADEVADYVGDAPVLTDAFAPVDQIVTRR